jgi:FlaA1/EpsC-like NDP-sugar epimerase/UDP-N-acetylmuramyl pentapeptide phosphotransferase/UDP-N-acetylglucosamine-1-phosphate transferase
MLGWRVLGGTSIPFRHVAALIGGGTVVAAASFADDLWGLKPQYRLFFQVLGAVIFIGLAGWLQRIDLPAAEHIMLGPLGLPLTVLWLVALTNIFNFMDGIDGLAAGVTAIVCIFIAIAARLAGNPPLCLYAAVLAGGAIGFLLHNFPPARIFMGDAGSTFLGFMVGGMAVIGSGAVEPGRAVPLLAICIMLGAFLFDTAMTMLRRIARGDSLFEPHRDYIFQGAVQLGLSHKVVTLTEYGLATLLGVSALLYLRLPGTGSWGVVLFWTAALIFLAERIDIKKRRVALEEKADPMLSSIPSANRHPTGRATRSAAAGGRTDRIAAPDPPGYKTVVLLVLMDCCLCALSYYAAYVANFVGFTPKFYEFMPTFFTTVRLVIPCRLLAFWAFGLYRRGWRRGRTQVLFDTLRAVAGSTLLVALLIWGMTGFSHYPRAVLVIDSLFVVYLIGFARFVLSIRRAAYARTAAAVPPARLLIVGAGKVGASVAREINSNPQLGYIPVGFVDDDRDKQDRRLHGVPVLGSIDRLPHVTREHEIDEILITIRYPARDRMKRIVDRCFQAGAAFKVMPAERGPEDEIPSVTRARNVNVLDLFGREPVSFDVRAVSRWLTGKRVLVTGAGGRLGLELCRRVATFDIAQLVLLDRDEQGIYEAGRQLESLATNTEWTAILGDIKDKEKLHRTFEKHRPEIVLHLAGSSNVPVAETNWDETVLNNVIGFKNVLECAARAGSQRLIFVSSTKAADPVGVVGCTRRIAELIVRQFENGDTLVAGVRVGNLVEDPSNVIALFERQIVSGGPVTLTHPDMARYFVKAGDAAGLLLMAAEMASDRRLYCLDSGEPVKIMGLAERLIQLSGLQPQRDIEIKVVGVRAGDKMRETLIGKNESHVPTSHRRILEVRSEQASEQIGLEMNVEKLERFALENDVSGMLRVMREIVPEFQSSQNRDNTEATSSG